MAKLRVFMKPLELKPKYSLLLAVILFAVVVDLGWFSSSRLDLYIYDNLKRFSGDSAWISFFSGVTWLGNEKMLALFFLPIPVLSFSKGWHREGFFYLLAVVACRFVVRSFKMFFGHERPLPYAGFEMPGSFSYPSGHAYGSLILYSVLVWVICRIFKVRHERGLSLFAVSLSGLVGFSRLALGVHWFTDVLGGFLLAAAILLLHSWIAEKYSFFKKA